MSTSPAPAEGTESLSRIYLYECDSLSAPIGTVSYEPVRTADYLPEKLRAITAG